MTMISLQKKIQSEKNSVAKGGLISDSFTFWLKSPNMGAKSLP